MKSNQSPRLAALSASLFANPSPNYALAAMFILMLGGMIVFGSPMAPGLATHVVMLLTMLATSRIFNTALLRLFWWLTVGLIAFVLLLDVVLLAVAA